MKKKKQKDKNMLNLNKQNSQFLIYKMHSY